LTADSPKGIDNFRRYKLYGFGNFFPPGGRKEAIESANSQVLRKNAGVAAVFNEYQPITRLRTTMNDNPAALPSRQADDSESELAKAQITQTAHQEHDHASRMAGEANISSEAALSRSEALLDATQRLSKVGGWEWNVEKQTMFWTAETYRIHDFDPNELIPGTPDHIEKSLACYEPSDRPVIIQAFQPP
jgi:hypothetical protein